MHDIRSEITRGPSHYKSLSAHLSAEESCLALLLISGEKWDSSREERREKKFHVTHIFQDYIAS